MSAERIRVNLETVESAVAGACRRAGRERSEVTLVAVSKTFPATAVDAALAEGIADVGENRVQEARDKRPLVKRVARWHLIGHLQSNKAAEAARLFDVVETVDSSILARRLGREAERLGRTIEVLLQVNVGGESQKSGVEPAEAGGLARELAQIAGLHASGLMTIPPAGDIDEARRCFSRLHSLRDQIRQELGEGFRHLSMGMSEDFEAAIEEGATIVRIGRGIFGTRG